MAKIRRRKIETNYTVVENDFLRDRELGLTERGLLITMLSLPDDWDYSANGLASILPDGKKKTNNSLQRLEKSGYLKRSRIYENGKVVDWLYEFCEQPIFKEENLLTQKGEVEKNLFTPFVQVEKVELQKVELQKGSDNKYTKELNTKELNTISNQSIHQYEPEKTATDRMIDRWIENNDTEFIKIYLKDKIDYEYCLESLDIYQEDLDNVISILEDMLTTKEPRVYNRRKYQPWQIRQQIEKLSGDTVKYALDNINAADTPIKNLRKYTEATLFFAPDTSAIAQSRDFAKARQAK